MFHMFLDCWWKLGAKLFDNLDWECVSLDFSHNVWSGCLFLKCSDTRFPQSKKKCAYSDQLFHIILVLAEVDYLITLRFEEFRSLQVVFPFGGWCSLWSLNDLWSLSSHSAESRNSFSPPLPSGLLSDFLSTRISPENLHSTPTARILMLTLCLQLSRISVCSIWLLQISHSDNAALPEGSLKSIMPGAEVLQLPCMHGPHAHFSSVWLEMSRMRRYNDLQVLVLWFDFLAVKSFVRFYN